jgi:hypothetical protein
MASVQDMQVGKLNEVTKVISMASVAVFPAIQIQYCGPKTFASVAVAAGGDMTFKADDTDGLTTVDPNIGCASGAQTALGIIDLSTPNAIIDTMGELVNWINQYGAGNWRAFLIGMLPSQKTDNTLVTLTESNGLAVTGDNGLTLYFDPATTFANGFTGIGYSITNEKFTCRPRGGWQTHQVGWSRNKKPGSNPALEVVNSFCYAEHTTAATNAGNLTCYAVDEISNAETLLYTGALFTTATAQAIGATPTPDTYYVSAPPGQRLVVWYDLVDTLMTAHVSSCIGKTKHRFGGEVPSANYTGCV